MDCKTVQQMVLPYVRRQLSDRELEEFLEHLETCPECYEELEIYYMIHVALERLDAENQSSFDIKKLLLDDLQDTRAQVRRRKIFRIYRYILIGLAEAALILVLLIQSEMNFANKKITDTTFYHMLYGSTDNGETTKSVEDTEPANKTTENMKKEKETNRKKKQVKTTPETEGKAKETDK